MVGDGINDAPALAASICGSDFLSGSSLPKPVRLPSALITLWQGTTIVIGLRWIAPPSKRVTPQAASRPRLEAAKINIAAGCFSL
jgi:hypothetical protein